MSIGIVGLGAIGGTVARLLADSACDVVAYDPVIERRLELGDVAEMVDSPAEVGEASELVLVAVFDDEQLRTVMTSARGILGVSKLPRAVVVLSTVTLETIRWCASRASAQGVELVDCGVSRGGGTEHGRKTLVAMVGAEPAAFAWIQPTLQLWADPVLHMGPLGSGMKAKVARNMMFYGFVSVAWEGAHLAASAGLDMSAFIAAAKACDRQGPVPYGLLEQGIGVPAPLPHNAELGARFARFAHKDLAAAFELGRESGVKLPIAARINELVDAVAGIDGGELER